MKRGAVIEGMIAAIERQRRLGDCHEESAGGTLDDRILRPRGDHDHLMTHRRERLELGFDIGPHATTMRRVKSTNVDDPHDGAVRDRAPERKLTGRFHRFSLACVASEHYRRAMSGRLLASIYDVSLRSESAFDALYARFASLGVERPTLLVVPDHWGEAPIRPGTPFATRLRALSDAGHEIFLHGWFHRDTAEHGGVGSFKAKHMTAGEGEFLGLSEVEAERRIRDGRTLLEDILGRSIAGLIAPAWLYGEGSHAALKATGIALAEDHWRVWNPVTGATLVKGSVITWASRTRMRRWSSLAVSAVARTVPLPRVMRLAVHPGGVTSPALLASISATLKSMLKSHRPARYADFQP